MPTNQPDPCHVCDSGRGELVDQLLWCGETYRAIVAELGWEPELWEDVKWHHLNGHVKDMQPTQFSVRMIRYFQKLEHAERRELEKSSDRQRPSVLDRADKGFRWGMDTIAKMSGLYVQGKGSKSAVSLLEQLAKDRPDLLKQLAKPAIEAQGTPVANGDEPA